MEGALRGVLGGSQPARSHEMQPVLGDGGPGGLVFMKGWRTCITRDFHGFLSLLKS